MARDTFCRDGATLLYNGLLCISTSFQVLRASESWLKHFLGLFSNFFVHFKHFSVIFLAEIKKKRFKTFEISSVLSYFLKLVDMQTLVASQE